VGKKVHQKYRCRAKFMYWLETRDKKDRNNLQNYLSSITAELNRSFLYLEEINSYLSMKEKILGKMVPLKVRSGRYKADDQLLVFLKSL